MWFVTCSHMRVRDSIEIVRDSFNICEFVTHWYAWHCYTLLHTATHCNTLQHTAKHYNTGLSAADAAVILVSATHCNTLPHTATPCNTLQHTATQCSVQQVQQQFCSDSGFCERGPLKGQTWRYLRLLQHTLNTAKHCNTLQHTATHCKTLQHTATHCNSLQHTSTHRAQRGRCCSDSGFCERGPPKGQCWCSSLLHWRWTFVVGANGVFPCLFCRCC